MKPRLTILLLTSVLVVWLFAPALGGGSSFAFRDAAHFYHPLFQYIRQEWGAGRLPLWDPYENLGVPLVAENTSSVFYPGKLLFALPADYTWLYNLYIVLHVVLAAGTSYALARHLRAGVLGASVAALSYAFSGSVLFQYCNVIFLVGAAWLPLALLYADRMLRERRSTATVGFGMTLALMVLGGDPQMAYNTALLAAGYTLLLWRHDKRAVSAAGPTLRAGWRKSRPLLLVAGMGLAGALAAIQALPTFEASPYSARARYDEPRSVYEFAQAWTQSTDDTEGISLKGLLGGSPRGHHAKVYYFSVEPWRAVELIWPNITGRPGPTHRRWLSAFDAESNFWMPSLYMGLLPFVLACTIWSLRRRANVVVRALSWMTLFGVLGSFGWYGIAWAVGLPVGSSEDFGVGGEVGGLYWCLATFLPGYIQFRYPSKLFVFASLGLSMLAAYGWRDVWESGSRRLLNWLMLIPLVGAAAGAGTLYDWPQIQSSLASATAAPWLGPLDGKGALTDFADALLHASMVSLVVLAILWLGRRTSYRRLMQVAMTAVVAIDLGAAQKDLVVYAPADLWRFRPRVLSRLPKDTSNYRLFRQLTPTPPSFETTASPDRYQEGLRWYRDTLWPRFPLPLEVPLAEVLQTVAGSDYAILLKVAQTHNRRSGRGGLPDPALLDLVGARSALVSMTSSEEISRPIEIAEDMLLGERPTALPRTWIVHDVKVLPPLESNSPRRIEKFTSEIAFPDGQPRDWRATAVVETRSTLSVSPVAEGTTRSESCRIVAAEPSRVEIDARLTAPGLVVLSDQHYPGWEAFVETDGERRTVPILRTNRVMRGVVLPAGKHRLVYRYRPRSILYGALISGASACVLLSVALVGWLSRRKRGNSAAKAPAIA